MQRYPLKYFFGAENVDGVAGARRIIRPSKPEQSLIQCIRFQPDVSLTPPSKGPLYNTGVFISVLTALEYNLSFPDLSITRAVL